MNRKNVFVAILVAVLALLGLTPIGSISFGFISITFMCLPVIVGTIVLGLGSGVMLGAAFGAISFIKLLLYPSVLLTPLFLEPLNWFDPALYLVLLFVPRILVAVIAYYVYRWVKPKNEVVRLSVASVAGSLINTVLFLGLLFLMFKETLAVNYDIDVQGVYTMLFGVGLTNGIAEAVVAAILCTPIIIAIRKTGRLAEVKT
jgi:uncharacterized membrane protein